MTAAMLMSDVGGEVVQVGAVRATAQTAGTSFTGTCPSHQSGDLLVAIAWVDNGGGLGGVSGWTTIASSGRASVYARIATGSGHDFFAGGYNSGDDVCVHIRCFRGPFVGLTAAQLVEAGFNGGSNDPDALTPTFGFAGAWIAAYGHTSGTPGGAPSGYSDYLSTINGTGNLASASRALAVGSEDPAAFGGGGGLQNAVTIAVRAP